MLWLIMGTVFALSRQVALKGVGWGRGEDERLENDFSSMSGKSQGIFDWSGNFGTDLKVRIFEN